jgi:hypothetical protein
MTSLAHDDTASKLEALRNRRTGYELVISRGAERYRVCYSRSAKSRNAIWECVTGNEARAKLLVAFTGSESIQFAKRAADGGTMGEWAINWSSRTERESILGGELPHFTDATSPVAFPDPSEPEAHDFIQSRIDAHTATGRKGTLSHPMPISGGSPEGGVPGFAVGDRVILSRVPFDDLRGKIGTVTVAIVGRSYIEVSVDGIATDDNYPTGRCISDAKDFDPAPVSGGSPLATPATPK